MSRGHLTFVWQTLLTSLDLEFFSSLIFLCTQAFLSSGTSVMRQHFSSLSLITKSLGSASLNFTICLRTEMPQQFVTAIFKHRLLNIIIIIIINIITVWLEAFQRSLFIIHIHFSFLAALKCDNQINSFQSAFQMHEKIHVLSSFISTSTDF